MFVSCQIYRCGVVGCLTLVVAVSCGRDPETIAAEGQSCSQSSDCQSSCACVDRVCRSLCYGDSDCDTDSYHCEDGACLPGAAVLCGNGFLDQDEQCDDGDRDDADGCSASCLVETKWICAGEPSKCEPSCGEGNQTIGDVCAYPSLTKTWVYYLDQASVTGGDYVLNAHGLQSYYHFGLDGIYKMWGTGLDGAEGGGDDGVIGWWFNDTETRYGVWYDGPGPDKIWFTEDDDVAWWENYLYEQVAPLYNEAGVDGMWFVDALGSTDDVQYACMKHELDEYGNRSASTYYSSPGPNGSWNDSDDIVGETDFGARKVTSFEGIYQRWNSFTTQVRYNLDGSVRQYLMHEFNDSRFPRFWTTERYYSAGGNGIVEWGEGDDIQTSYIVAEHTP